MSIASVVTEGYGPGATIPLVVLSGYGVGVVVVPPARRRIFARMLGSEKQKATMSGGEKIKVKIGGSEG